LKRFVGIFAGLGLVAGALGGAGTAAGGAPAPTAADPASYIVVYRDKVDVDAKTTALERAQGFASAFRYRHALRGFAATLSAPQLERLSADPDVAFISPDRTVEAVGTAPLAAGETAPTGIRRVAAASTTTARQASTANVAVIDTGIDLFHPDLNAVNGKNCVRTTQTAQDDNGHGTHVSGTIAAKNTGAGAVGVAPGTRLYAVKVLNSQGSGTWSQVICGIDWVAANASSLNIKVANMSLGGSGSNDNNCGNTNADALHTAICNGTSAGVTFVIAAGNSGTGFGGSVPAAYPEVLTVTAMSDSDGGPGGTGGSPTCRFGEADDYYASFSNFAVSSAEIAHTIAGPGVCIYSTWPGGGYNTISGTSMATPHVTGSVALCLGDGGTPGPCAGMTPAQIIQKMRSDAAAHSNADPAYGFVGDPNHAVGSAYFGYLVWDGTAPATLRLAFATAPQTLTAGTPSGPMTVQIQDSAGAPQTATSALSVNLSSSSSNGSFATSTSGPWTSTLSVTIPAGSSTSGAFYYRDTQAGSPSLSATATGYGAGSQTETVNAGAIATVNVSPASATVTLGGTQSFTASGSDAYGNPVDVSSATWSVGAGTPGSVSPPSGTSTAFTASSSTTGSGTVIATAGGVSGNAAVTVVPAPTSVSVSSIIYALQGGRGQHILITVALTDNTGAPVAGASVSVDIYYSGILLVGSGTGTTGANGAVTFKVLNASSGCYSTAVTNVTAAGLTWDGTTPANSFCK
jgi:subtilisin family serine protease